MKICLFNDLHIEWTEGEWLPPDPQTFDVMILAGDIFPIHQLDEWVGHMRAPSFLRQLAALEKPVLWVAGNHEYYGTSVKKNGPHILKEVLRQHAHNVTFLNNKKIDIEGVHFFGGTMWTDFGGGKPSERAIHMSTAYRRMNDYRYIKWDNVEGTPLAWTPQHAYQEHVKFMKALGAWLKREDLKGERVIITHHSPLTNDNSRFIEGSAGSLHHAYVSSDCPAIMAQYPIALWCHGHTHECRDDIYEKTRVVSNARGYIHAAYPERKVNAFKEEGLIIEV